MKVLFLDLDGVLNNKLHRESTGDDYQTKAIDQKKMELLAEIVGKTGANIVFSSSWRGDWKFDPEPDDKAHNYLVNSFDQKGLKIYSKTPMIYKAKRAEEVEFWLENSGEKIENFAILDDNDFFSGHEKLKDHFVKTDDEIGLSEDDVKKVIYILNYGISEDEMEESKTKYWLRQIVQDIFSARLYELPKFRVIKRFFVSRAMGIKDNVIIGHNARFVRHHLVEGGGVLSVGKNVLILEDVSLDYSGELVIGDDVSISERAVIYSHRHLNSEIRSAENTVTKKTVIEKGAWVGAGSFVMAGLTIGENSVIGAGSIVTHDVPPNTIWAGNPARYIKDR